MNIIPVIDIKGGLVVSAQQGRRESYQPIKSKLCQSSNITAVIDAFLTLYPFKVFYIADLNAITHSGDNEQLINKAVTDYKHIEFWIDNGEKIENLAKSDFKNIKTVIGSESQNRGVENRLPFSDSFILSLDFNTEKNYTGPNELLKNSDLWPRDIIVMTLDRVGSNAGPDLKKLAHFHQAYSDKNIIAAGGIRNADDLLQLKKIGINYALVSTALHSGTITAETIKKQ